MAVAIEGAGPKAVVGAEAGSGPGAVVEAGAKAEDVAWDTECTGTNTPFVASGVLAI